MCLQKVSLFNWVTESNILFMRLPQKKKKKKENVIVVKVGKKKYRNNLLGVKQQTPGGLISLCRDHSNYTAEFP